MIRSKYRNRSIVEKPWSAETISPLVKFYFFVRVDKRVVSIYIYIYRGLHTRRINRDSVSIDLLSRTPVRQRSSNREGIFRKNLSCPLNGESESRFDARITAEASNAPPQPNRRENATRPSYWPCVTALHTDKGSNALRRFLSLSLSFRSNGRKHRFEEAYREIEDRRGACSFNVRG